MKEAIILAALTLSLGCGKKEPVQSAASDIEATKPAPTNAKPTPKVDPTKHERFLWKFETGGPIDSSPAIGLNGNIYFGSQDNKVYALSSKTGQKIWDFETNGEVNASPTVSPENIVLIGSMGGKFYALDGDSGKTIWDFSDTSGFYSSSAIADGKVYFGSTGGNLYALDIKTGKRIKTIKAHWGPFTPAIGSDGMLYFGAGATYFGYDTKADKLKWKYKSPEWASMIKSSPAISQNNSVYVGFGGANKSIYSLNGKTGGKEWEFKTDGGIWSSPSIGKDGTILTESDDGKLYAIYPFSLDGKTAEQQWEFESKKSFGKALGMFINSTPAIGENGIIYFGSDDKHVYAIDIKTGNKKWEFKTNGIINSSPALDKTGIIYIGSRDKALYAIKTDSKGLAKSPWPMFGQNPQHTGRALAK